jgi:Xaa-Pro dipeptidase
MRIKALTESIGNEGIDAFIITGEANIFYYTGSISGGILIITAEQPLLLAPKLNYSIAVDQARDVTVEPYIRKNMVEKVYESCSKAKPEKIGFNELGLKTYQSLNELFNSELEARPDLIWDMRKIKQEKEIGFMKKASKLTDIGMKAGRDVMKEGVSEHEISAEIAYAMRKAGAEDYAFPFIVASGPRSAYPHAGVTDRKVRLGDFITVDMGARFHGYCTDLTRTFIVGQPNDKQRSIYQTVLKANTTAFKYIIEGARCSEVDKVARDIIEKNGFGEHFIHGLGHGVGLEVHEPPSLSQSSEETLRNGNMVTNEPGVYIHGYGGVRVEDTVMVSGDKPESITHFPKKIEDIIV